MPRAFAEFADVVENLVDQGRVDAGGRLVKEDQIGIAHQGAAQLDHLLFGVRQVAAIFVSHTVEPNHAQQIPRPVELLAFFRPVAAFAGRPARSRSPRCSFGPVSRFSSTVTRRKTRTNLKGPREAGLGDRVRWQPGDLPSFEEYLAGGGRRKPVIRLKTVVLPEPFGPIETLDRALGDFERAAINGA